MIGKGYLIIVTVGLMNSMMVDSSSGVIGSPVHVEAAERRGGKEVDLIHIGQVQHLEIYSIDTDCDIFGKPIDALLGGSADTDIGEFFLGSPGHRAAASKCRTWWIRSKAVG
jgi:hypothetical protein